MDYDEDSPFHFLLFEEDKGLFDDLAGYAFRQTHERFQGTALGDFCDFAINTDDNDGDHLVFSLSG